MWFFYLFIRCFIWFLLRSICFFLFRYVIFFLFHFPFSRSSNCKPNILFLRGLPKGYAIYSFEGILTKLVLEFECMQFRMLKHLFGNRVKTNSFSVEQSMSSFCPFALNETNLKETEVTLSLKLYLFQDFGVIRRFFEVIFFRFFEVIFFNFIRPCVLLLGI